MFIKELVISGLRKQYSLLAELIDHLERKPSMDSDDHSLYGHTADTVAQNLRALRRIKRQYVSFMESVTFSD